MQESGLLKNLGIKRMSLKMQIPYTIERLANKIPGYTRIMAKDHEAIKDYEAAELEGKGLMLYY